MASTISKRKKRAEVAKRTFCVESLIQTHHRNKCIKTKIYGSDSTIINTEISGIVRPDMELRREGNTCKLTALV